VIDAAFAIPGDITLPTGGYAYSRKVLDLLPDLGVRVRHVQLPSTYPYPDHETVEATRRIFAKLNSTIPVLVDGLAYGAMPPLMVNGIASPIAALVHHPLAYETGVKPSDKRRFIAFETHALARAQKVIANSEATARLLQREYDVPADKLAIATPGTHPAQRAQGSGSPLQLLSVGALIPRKGYTVLIDALAQIPHKDWRLTIVGATTHHPVYAEAVRDAIAQAGFGEQIELTDALSDQDLNDQFLNADVFVMPSLFEGYGMVLSEAIARGLPIVCTKGGAMSETVPDDAALKVEPGDTAALAAAIDKLLSDSTLRRKLADASWNQAQKLPTWKHCTHVIADVLKSLAKHPGTRVPD